MTDLSGFPDPSRIPASRPSAPFAASPARPKSPWVFPVAASGLLSFLLCLAWFTQGPVGTPSLASGPAQAPAPDRVDDPPSTPAAPTTEGLVAIRGEIAGLSQRVGELQAKLANPAAATPLFDPAPLQAEIQEVRARIDELGKRPTPSAPAPAETKADLRPLQARLDEMAKLPVLVGDLQKRLQNIQDRVGANADELAAMKGEMALRSAALLFQQRRYGPALEEFRRLQQTHPTDARVWYYSSLASGLLSNSTKWDGEALAWVNEGVVREQAGTPDTAQIDAEFAGLIRATGREWLDYYRKQVRP